MERSCGVCHDRPFRFRCIQCHRPVCDDCAFKTTHGAFCSRDCATKYGEFKRSQVGQAPRASRSALKVLVLLAILAAAALGAAYALGWMPRLGAGP